MKVLTISLLFCYIACLFTYMAHRSSHKSACRKLLNNTPLRPLTLKEREYIKPFLAKPGRPGQFHQLVNDKVYELNGQFSIYSASYGSVTEPRYKLIDNVQVVLPYGAEAFLKEENHAQVVVASDFAIVLALNEEFDIVTDFENELQDQVAMRKLAGSITTPHNAADQTQDKPSINEPVTEKQSGERSTQVFMLGQRDETAWEIAARKSYSAGWLEAISMLIGFILLVVASNSHGNYLGYALASVPFFLLTLWQLFRPSRELQPERVNIASGPMIEMRISSPVNDALFSSSFFLGESIYLNVPPHWQEHLLAYADQQVEAHVRVFDNALLKIGNDMSVAMEEERFPSRQIRWLRPLLLSIVGVLSLLISVMLIDNLANDYAYTKASFFNTRPLEINDYQQVLTTTPAIGRLVNINANVRCHIPSARKNTAALPPIDCGTVRWGGEKLQVGEVSLPEDLAALDRGGLLAAREDTFATLQQTSLSSASLHASGHQQAYSHSNDLYILDDLPGLLTTVDGFCSTSISQTPCNTFKEALLKSLFENSRTKKQTRWQELIDAAKTNTVRWVPIRKTDIDRLKGLMQEMVAPQIKPLFTEPFQKLRQSQRGGVLLKLPEEIAVTLTERLPPQTNLSWTHQWAAYQILSGPESLFPVSLKGLVVRNGKNAAGEIMLSIDTNTNVDQYHRAPLRIIALAIALLLTAFSLPVCIIRINRAIARKKAIKAYYETRSLDFM